MKSEIFIYTGTALIFIMSSLNEVRELHRFLRPQTSEDNISIFPAPPEKHSVAFITYAAGHALRNNHRARFDREDANYKHFGKAFSPAFGLMTLKKHTPEICELLTSFLHDRHDFVMRRAKTHYRRMRPFVIYHDAKN